MDNDYKICKRCGENKSIIEFYKNKNSKDGFANKCKTCESKYHKVRYRIKKSHRKSHLKLTYKLTVEQFDEMYKNQGGACAICFTKDAKLVVDHDHITGEPRGLLCNGCNHALGRFKDNPRTILNAFTYITHINTSDWSTDVERSDKTTAE